MDGALRHAAGQRGANVEVLFFEVGPAEQRRRLDQRLVDEPHTTWPISEDELVSWAAHGVAFVAAVENGPLSATQFHPEKSGDAGATLLENWVSTL